MEPYCKPSQDNTHCGVECLSYLINWNWEGLEKVKEDSSFLIRRQKGFQMLTDIDQNFDFETASEEWLDPDPRLRWLRKAILNQPIIKEEQQMERDEHMTITSRLDDPLYPISTCPYVIPLHRALSCDVRFCSWMGQEGYIRALATVNPTSLEVRDDLTGLYAFQVAALRRGDLDSSYHLLRMCPYLLL